MKQLKYQIHNAQNRRSIKIESCIFKTYKNDVIPCACRIHNTAKDMTMSTIYPYSFTHHGLPHWKCELGCYEKFPSISIPSQEANKDNTNMLPTMHFHVY